MARIRPCLSNVLAFLDLIAFSEGSIRFGDDEGYNVIVGGSLFFDYSDHPRKVIKLSKTLSSSAAGRYQLLARYFNPYKQLLLLNDFSPVSQDKIAIQQIKEQNALKLIIDGDIIAAIRNCSNIWASFPGAGYGQRENNINTLLMKFVEYGGKVKC